MIGWLDGEIWSKDEGLGMVEGTRGFWERKKKMQKGNVRECYESRVECDFDKSTIEGIPFSFFENWPGLLWSNRRKSSICLLNHGIFDQSRFSRLAAAAETWWRWICLEQRLTIRESVRWRCIRQEMMNVDQTFEVRSIRELLRSIQINKNLIDHSKMAPIKYWEIGIVCFWGIYCYTQLSEHFARLPFAIQTCWLNHWRE
jgi:hypothetical protein